MAAFQITITTGAGTPIYRQIVDQVRLGVATGVLAPGGPMPSVRNLADRLVINANTVAKAYAELVRDGVLDSQQGLGFFNLVPFPGLDGGRLVFLCYELITRKRPNERIEVAVHAVGILFLLGVIALVTMRDVVG